MANSTENINMQEETPNKSQQEFGFKDLISIVGIFLLIIFAGMLFKDFFSKN